MVLTEAPDVPAWVRAYGRRRLRRWIAGLVAALLLVLGFVAKQGFQRWSWLVAVGFGLTILLAVGGYVRWIGSEKYCKNLPAARRYPSQAQFHRCVLIDRSVGTGCVDRSGVVVISASRVELCVITLM